MKAVGAIGFFIGIVMIACSLTVTPSSNLLLAGIIIAGGGFAVARYF